MDDYNLLNQKDKKLIKVFGYVRNYELKSRGSEDPIYKFNLSDTQDSKIEPIQYSGFKDPGFKEGDFVVIKYEKKGEYNNVKYIIQHKITNTQPETNSLSELVRVDTLEASNGNAGGGHCPFIPPELKIAKSDIMARCIEFGTKFNYDSDEIIAMYARHLNKVGIEI